MTVVDDREDLLILWFPKGTTWKRPVTPSGRPKAADRGERHASLLAAGDWIFVDACWDVSTLVLMRAGEWHATWVSWLDDDSQWGWYVNLQEPFRRTRRGFETMDLVLDVLVDNDRTWRWKDEDELATFVRARVFDAKLAGRLRAEGLRVVRRAQLHESPFDVDWRPWRPPALSTPQLEPGWDERCR